MSLEGRCPEKANFQDLFGIAFIALDSAVPEIPEQSGEPAIKSMERGHFTAALGVNRVRNLQGVGHGMPWVHTLSSEEAKAAIEIVDAISAYLPGKLSKRARRPS
jgi:hypothetical protein